MPAEVVLVIDCSHCKTFSSYVEMKPFLVKLVPIVFCPLLLYACEQKVSILFVVAI